MKIFISKFILIKHAVFDPEQMLQLVLAQVHYQPDSWKEHAHTDYVQAEFGQMFQLKYVSKFRLSRLFVEIVF
jgi:autophagy-related protein 9